MDHRDGLNHMALVLGIDSSTQSTKAELRVLATGELVAVGRGAHPTTSPPRSEQDPGSWWAALEEAVGALGDRLPEVVALAVAGQQHGLVVVDADDRVIRPAKLWNDTESAPEADALVSAIGARAWARACGSVPVPAFTITKLAWLASHEPDAFARVHRLMLPHDWLTWRLSGRHVTDRGDASGTGWWSPIEDGYRLDLLELVADDVDWGARLPEVLRPDEPAGTISADAAARLGLTPSTLVAPGTGDNMAAALGLGLDPGGAVISLGTSGTVFAVSDAPTADASGAVAGFADAWGRFLPLVCTLNATKVTDSVARLLGVDHEELDRLALAAEPGAGGVVVVPYLDGERTPNLPHATGSVLGLTSGVAREEVARAGFEGVVCGLLAGLDALMDAGVAVGPRLLLVGGGAKAASYRRVLADLARREVVVPATEEAVAAGASVQAAAVATGASAGEVAEAWGLGAGPVTEPDDRVDADAIRGRYQAGASTAGEWATTSPGE